MLRATARDLVTELSSRNALTFADTAEAEATYIGLSTDTVIILGARSDADALYRVVASEPTHGLKFQSLDSRWWEIAEPVIYAPMAGLACDHVLGAAISTATDDTAAFNVWVDAGVKTGRPLRWIGGIRLTPNPVKTITDITLGNPTIIECTAHGYAGGERVCVQAVGGTTELNGNTYTVSLGADNDHFTLNVNSTAFGAYTSGGTAQQIHTLIPSTTGSFVIEGASPYTSYIMLDGVYTDFAIRVEDRLGYWDIVSNRYESPDEYLPPPGLFKTVTLRNFSIYGTGVGIDGAGDEQNALGFIARNDSVYIDNVYIMNVNGHGCYMGYSDDKIASGVSFFRESTVKDLKVIGCGTTSKAAWTLAADGPDVGSTAPNQVYLPGCEVSLWRGVGFHLLSRGGGPATSIMFSRLKLHGSNSSLNDTKAIAGITLGTQTIIETTTDHEYLEGETIVADSIGGTVEITDGEYTISNVGQDSTHFILKTTAGADIDSTLYTPWTSGGTVANYIRPKPHSGTGLLIEGWTSRIEMYGLVALQCANSTGEYAVSLIQESVSGLYPANIKIIGSIAGNQQNGVNIAGGYDIDIELLQMLGVNLTTELNVGSGVTGPVKVSGVKLTKVAIHSNAMRWMSGLKCYAQFTTINATPTNLETADLADNQVYHLYARVLAQVVSAGADLGKAASYTVEATANCLAGTATIINQTPVHSGESIAGLDAAFTASGDDVSITVTGQAVTNITWQLVGWKVDYVGAI